MHKIMEFAGRELKWKQPSAFRMHYELRSGEEFVGLLDFRSSFGSLATAESGDGCWTFKRVGFFQTRVTIRACGSEADIAVFRNNTWSGGGTLEMANGRKFQATTSLWRTRLEFSVESGEPLLRLHSGGLVHHSAAVELLPMAGATPEAKLMVMLGWYLILMMNRDAAASAVVVG